MKILVLFALVLMPTGAFAEDLWKIVVRDPNFEIVREISLEEELTQFSKLWDGKVKKGNAELNVIYKIDFVPGDRWLYDPAGVTRVLSKGSVESFQVPDVKVFNQLLGIDE